MTTLASVSEPIFAERLRLGVLPSLDRALVLDTEFMTTPGAGRRIFALGLGWVRDGHLGSLVLFPDSAPPLIEVGGNLLRRVTRERVPALTWCGTTADLAPAECLVPGIEWPAVREALRPYHVDLYRLVRRHAALPLPRYGLKDVAAALGIHRESTIRSGWAVPRLYVQSCAAPAPERTWQRRALRRYLADDLRLTYDVARALVAQGALRAEGDPCGR